MSSADQFQRFSIHDIQQVVHATFIQDVEHHVSLPSTNSHALSKATDRQLDVPLLVLTDRQTAGRGRGANPWWSASGALAFSLILERPEMQDAAGWPRVALTTGIAVCEAFHQLCPGLDAALKWPNDVYVRARKISGILVEVPPQATQRIVVGVGVNVNNALSKAPASIRSSATSLVDVAGYPFSLANVLIAILNQLSEHLALLQHDPLRLQQRWETFCMLTGKTVEIVAGSRSTVGICHGINTQGALLVETPAGVQPCLSGVVTRWE